MNLSIIKKPFRKGILRIECFLILLTENYTFMENNIRHFLYQDSHIHHEFYIIGKLIYCYFL
ncbi:hypothetical protein XNC1_1893 [Xenorhabdus nematophila ATCC 19061]|uniref:Uncharacterized protein n=1 Tax=Xenorhabdus nematophila (strain ATCC 19061 / DSM 3370 / CCUG 14189 / LMG 1036 / NCIMB 9965 / AN6) TaxID=406817 RepID=D3VDN6_XENNA|nr:hypothetical protein XNC1_1893 [Xenorhabdus nematophila ATCC 19061]